MKKLIIIVFALVFTLSTSNAQVDKSTTKVATTAAQFLKIGVGARPIAMGGAYSAMPGDINSAYWNPAGISRIYGGEVTFNHVNWLADIKYDFFAATYDISGLGTLGATVVSYNVPEDIVRTYKNPEGDGRVFDAGAIAIGLVYAQNLTDRFSIGVSAKVVREWIWNESAMGLAVDIGTLYITPFNDLKIGASISNFGTKMQLEGRDLEFLENMQTITDNGTIPNIRAWYEAEKYEMPLTFRVGLAMDVLKYDNILRATAAVDAVHPNDNSEYLNVGMEFSYDEMFFVRAGYKTLFMKDAEGGLTVGGGISCSIGGASYLRVDYALADYDRLKQVHFISLSVKY